MTCTTTLYLIQTVLSVGFVCDKRAMDTSNTCHNPDKLDSLVTMVEKLLDKLADFEGKMNDKCDVVVSNELDARRTIKNFGR